MSVLLQKVKSFFHVTKHTSLKHILVKLITGEKAYFWATD